jgi:hypothetical protein
MCVCVCVCVGGWHACAVVHSGRFKDIIGMRNEIGYTLHSDAMRKNTSFHNNDRFKL